MIPDEIETNKAAIRSIYEVCLNTGNMESLAQLISPDFVGVNADIGPEGFAATLMGLRSGFPDIQYTVEDVIGDNDRVAVRWIWTGTHKNDFRGFMATNATMRNSGVSIYQMREGKIFRAWIETDRLGFLLQIGALPAEFSARIQPPSVTDKR